MAARAPTAVQRAQLHACVALEAVPPPHAADAGATVATLAVRVGAEHPVVAIKAKSVPRLLGRRHFGQWNVGEDPDRRVLAAVVLVRVPHAVVQHMKLRQGLRHVLLLEIRKQQNDLDGGVRPLNVQQGLR